VTSEVHLVPAISSGDVGTKGPYGIREPLEAGPELYAISLLLTMKPDEPTRAKTFPLTIASGIGPYVLESVELLRLSPASQI